jgi:hypothetical protein
MVPAWVVTTIFLRIWLVGLMLFLLLSFSDFVFRRPHSLATLGRRIATGLVWPLALASAAGRHALFASFLSSPGPRPLAEVKRLTPRRPEENPR